MLTLLYQKIAKNYIYKIPNINTSPTLYEYSSSTNQVKAINININLNTF